MEPGDGWVAIAPAEDRLHEDDAAAGQTLLPPLLRAGVTAIAAYNDMIAIGVLAACREQGINVPRELSVIGFDDIPMAAWTSPPLTTMRQPLAEIASLAVRMLLDPHTGDLSHRVELATKLVVRGSTAALRIEAAPDAKSGRAQ